jgi:hypothetical protein
MKMQLELNESVVNGIAMTTEEKNHYDAWVEWDTVPADEAREVVDMIRHLGLTLDVRGLRANRKIITAGKKVRQAEEEGAAKAKKEAMEQKELQELSDLRERQAVWIFCQKHPEIKLSGTTAESYQRWAAKNGITTFSLQSLEGWFANCKSEVLPAPPKPVVVTPTPDTNILEPLPARLSQLEFIQTRKDVWNCPPVLFKFGMKFKEFVDRINRIEREKR